MPATGVVSNLYRYPVKGLSPERLDSLHIDVDRGLENDRRWALALPRTEFDADRPMPLAKTSFLMLVRYSSLAKVHSEIIDSTLRLVVDGRQVLSASLHSDEGREAIESFFATFMNGQIEGRPRLVQSPCHRFTDISVVSPGMMRAISLINLGSVQALEAAIDLPLDPLRFRANVYVVGATAWSEGGWKGREIKIGSARFRVVAQNTRCAATEVNPRTGVRDIPVVRHLKEKFGHVKMGIYLEVLKGGSFTIGDEVLVGS